MSDSGIVTFDFGVFSARYPEFASLDPALAQLYFNEATLVLDNTPCSPVTDVGQRAVLLNMLTAHLAQLYKPGSSSTIVGHVTSASEGSVSVGVEGFGSSPQIAWYMQTRYGASYWNATQAYRSARWIRGNSPYLGVGPSYPSSGWW